AALEASSEPLSRVVPVLARDGLLERLQGILRAQGVPFECVSASEPHPTGPCAPRDDSIGLVVFSPGVDERFVRLARVATGAPSIPLLHGIDALERALSGRRRSVLWLFEPDETPPDRALAFARCAESLGISWGMIFAIEPVAARFALLKSALVHRVKATGAFGFISSAYRVPGVETAQPTRIGEGAAVPKDVLLMAGHANVLDARIGRETVFCAREDYRGTGTDLWACFNGGRCHRQPHDGPEHELIGVSQSKAHVLVLSGCSVLPLGKSWGRTEATLPYQIANSDTLAFMAPSSMSLGRFELDLLCVGLLYEGRPVGQVVRHINRIRRDVLEEPTGLPPGIGPFVLIGNPELRLDGAPLAEQAAESGPASSETYTLVLDRSDRFNRTGAKGALLRVPMRARAAIPYVTLTGLSEGIDCRGVWFSDRSSSGLYLYVTGSSGEDRPTARIEVRDEDAGAPVIRTLEAWWTTFAFWSMFLYGAQQEMLRAGSPSSELSALFDELPRLTNSLSNYFSWIEPPRGVITADKALGGEQGILWDTIEAWSRRMLDGLIAFDQVIGQTSSAGNPPFLFPVRPVSDAESCPCGGQMLGHLFQAPGERCARIHRQCHLCGNSRDDDGTISIQWTPIETVAAGETLRCRVTGRAPDDRFVHLHIAGVLETWRHKGRVVGSRHHEVFAPGSEIDVIITIDVPEDLLHGIYPTGLVGVANGTLLYMRRLLPYAPRH
ncbi:MAG: hypothetical protein AAF449_12160, partial [Myxococcota bacterium]